MGTSPKNRASIGRAAEDLVLDDYLKQGWSLLHRNWRWRGGELDLVFYKAQYLLILEVRSRLRTDSEYPWISPHKLNLLYAGARAYVQTIRGLAIDEVRLELVQVQWGEPPRISRVPLY